MPVTVDYYRGEGPAEQGAGIFPRFYLRAKENPGKTKSAGRPIFEDIEYVEITIAGDKQTQIDRKVTNEDKARWPDHYKAFQDGLEAPVEGTPLQEWPVITESKRKELLALHIKTVEALAQLNDNGINRLGMGGRELVKKAQAFVEQAEGMAPINNLIEENEQLTEQLAAQQSQIDDLMKKMAAIGKQEAANENQ